jgi:SET domain-containing protein
MVTGSNWELRFSGMDYRALFATEKIRQGETIITLPQSTVPNPDKYSLEIFPGIHVDCSYSPAGAINHSCRPSASVKGNRIVAWRCIQPGEEITLDYKRTEHKLSAPFDCNCGNCEGKRIE